MIVKRSEIVFGLLRIPVDFLAALGALWGAYFLRAREDVLPDFFKRPDLGSFPTIPQYMELSLAGAIALLILLALFRLYALKVTDSLSAEIRKIFSASLIWLMASITYYFVIRQFPFSRLVLFYAFAFLFLFVSVGRIIIKNFQRYLLQKGIGKRLIIFVGENAITNELKDILERSLSARILGIAKDFHDLSEMLGEGKDAEEIIQTQDDHEQAEHIIDFCREHHLQYHFVPDLLEVHRSNIEISALGGIPIISLRPTPLDGWGRVLKRSFDLIGSSIGLILLSPVLLIIAIAIKLDSAGTIFFRFLDGGELAHRIGERGRPFHCLKFRTMKMGTHNMRYRELAGRNLRQGTPMVKIQNDPRITRVGNFLRRFSLDEIPQLWNVFKGEMSLVGPRPHLPEEVENYDQHHKFLLTIKPGITGLAQISGRSDLPFEEEVRLDTYYIENWSLWLDMKIFLKTVLVILKPYRE
jgi:exopolysaccharide biosynthesis polyprenyl glycosylphosphotransferase